MVIILTAKMGSFENELLKAFRKGNMSKICRIISIEEFTFFLMGMWVAASEECAIGVAGGEGLSGVARVDDLVSAEKQENDMGIRARRDANSGVRNVLASSGAEIQAKQELSGKLADDKSRNSNE